MTYKIRHTEKAAGALLILFAVAVFVESADYRTGPSADPGTAFFPRTIAILLAVFGGIQIVQSYRTGETRTFEIERQVAKRVVGAALAPIVYLLMLPIGGFLLSTTAFLIGFMYYSGARSVTRMIASSLVVTLGLFYVFGTVFYVPLPEGVIPISRLLPVVIPRGGI